MSFPFVPLSPHPYPDQLHAPTIIPTPPTHERITEIGGYTSRRRAAVSEDELIRLRQARRLAQFMNRTNGGPKRVARQTSATRRAQLLAAREAELDETEDELRAARDRARSRNRLSMAIQPTYWAPGVPIRPNVPILLEQPKTERLRARARIAPGIGATAARQKLQSKLELKKRAIDSQLYKEIPTPAGEESKEAEPELPSFSSSARFGSLTSFQVQELLRLTQPVIHQFKEETDADQPNHETQQGEEEEEDQADMQEEEYQQEEEEQEHAEQHRNEHLYESSGSDTDSDSSDSSDSSSDLPNPLALMTSRQASLLLSEPEERDSFDDRFDSTLLVPLDRLKLDAKPPSASCAASPTDTPHTPRSRRPSTQQTGTPMLGNIAETDEILTYPATLDAMDDSPQVIDGSAQPSRPDTPPSPPSPAAASRLLYLIRNTLHQRSQSQSGSSTPTVELSPWLPTGDLLQFPTDSPRPSSATQQRDARPTSATNTNRPRTATEHRHHHQQQHQHHRHPHHAHFTYSSPRPSSAQPSLRVSPVSTAASVSPASSAAVSRPTSSLGESRPSSVARTLVPSAEQAASEAEIAQHPHPHAMTPTPTHTPRPQIHHLRRNSIDLVRALIVGRPTLTRPHTLAPPTPTHEADANKTTQMTNRSRANSIENSPNESRRTSQIEGKMLQLNTSTPATPDDTDTTTTAHPTNADLAQTQSHAAKLGLQISVLKSLPDPTPLSSPSSVVTPSASSPRKHTRARTAFFPGDGHPAPASLSSRARIAAGAHDSASNTDTPVAKKKLGLGLTHGIHTDGASPPSAPCATPTQLSSEANSPATPSHATRKKHQHSHSHSFSPSPSPPNRGIYSPALMNDPKDLSLIPALRLDKSLDVSLKHKLYDKRFVSHGGKSSRPATPTTPYASVGAALTRLRKASMIISQATVVTNIMRGDGNQPATTSTTAATSPAEAKLSNQTTAANAPTNSNGATPQPTMTMADMPPISLGLGIVGDEPSAAAPIQSHGNSASIAPSLAPSSLGSPHVAFDAAMPSSTGITYRSTDDPAHPSHVVPGKLGLPMLEIPILPPSSFVRFNEKWHSQEPWVDAATSANGDAAAKKSSKDRLYQLKSQKPYEVVEEPMPPPPPPKNDQDNIYELKIVELDDRHRAEARMAERERTGPTDEEWRVASRVHISQTESDIMAPLTTRRVRRGSVPNVFQPDLVPEVEAVVDAIEESTLMQHRPADEVDPIAAAARAAKEEANLPPPTIEQPDIASTELFVHRIKSFAAEQVELDQMQLGMLLAVDDSDDDSVIADGASDGEDFTDGDALWHAELPQPTSVVEPTTITTTQKTNSKSNTKKVVKFGDDLTPTTDVTTTTDQEGATTHATPQPNEPDDHTHTSADHQLPTPTIVEDGEPLTQHAIDNEQRDGSSEVADSSSAPSVPGRAPPSPSRSVRPRSAAPPLPPCLEVHHPSFVDPPSVSQEHPHLRDRRLEQCRAYFDGPTKGSDDALSFGFDDFDPNTHMVIDGLIMQKPFKCTWQTKAEARVKQLHNKLYTIDRGYESTNNANLLAWSRRAASLLTSHEQGHGHGTRLPSSRPSSASVAPHAASSGGVIGVSAGRSTRPSSGDAHFQSRLHALLYRTSRATAAKRERMLREANPLEHTAGKHAAARAAELERELTAVAEFRSGPIDARELVARSEEKVIPTVAAPLGGPWIAVSNPNGVSQHCRAKSARYTAKRPQSARPTGNHTTRVAAGSTPNTPRPHHTPTTVQPTELNSADAPEAVPQVPVPPTSARPASSRPVSARACVPSSGLNPFIFEHSSLFGRDGRLVDEDGGWLAASNKRPNTARTRSRRATMQHAVTNGASTATFLHTDRLTSKLTGSLVAAMVRSRPSSATGVIDVGLPVAHIRPAERKRAISDAMQRQSSLNQPATPFDDADSGDRAARRECRKQARAVDHEARIAARVDSTAQPDNDRRAPLTRESSAKIRSIRSNSPASGTDTVGSDRGSASPKRRRKTATEMRMEIEKELLLYAARPPDPRFVIHIPPPASAPILIDSRCASPQPPSVQHSVPVSVQPSGRASPELTRPVTPMPHTPMSVSVPVSVSVPLPVAMSSSPSADPLVAASSAPTPPTAPVAPVAPPAEFGALLRHASMVRAEQAKENEDQLKRAEERREEEKKQVFTLRESDNPEEQQKFDESFIRALESLPVWRSAISRMCADDDGDGGGYELPIDLDRRLIALIAAGEYEIRDSSTIDPLVREQRPILIDGVRCIRQIAIRRLDKLYGKELEEESNTNEKKQ